MSDTVGPHTEQLLEERVDDEIVVYNRATDSYYTLNTTARAVWDLATGDHTLDEIVSMLADEFATEPETIRQDVSNIVTEFTDAGLLRDG